MKQKLYHIVIYCIIACVAMMGIAVPTTAMAATKKTLVIDGKTRMTYEGPYGKIELDGKLLTNLPMPALMIDKDAQGNGSYIVPVREVFEGAGANVIWDADRHYITITYNKDTITLQVGSYSAYINGNESKLLAAPRMIAYEGDKNAKVMVPVRFIMEAMNKDVSYNDKTQTVIVKAKTNTTPSTPTTPTTPTTPSDSALPVSTTYHATSYYHNSTLTAALVEFTNAVPSYQVMELDNPHRIVIDVAGSDASAATKKIGDGVVTEIRIGKQPNNVTRIVVESPKKLYYKVAKVKSGKTVGIRLSQTPIPKESGIVMIDPGHGGNTGSSVKVGSTTYWEDAFTLSMGRKIYDSLKSKGVPVYLTRDSNVALDLYDRPELGNLFGASLFLSVHCNKFTTESANGTETLYYNKSYTGSISAKDYAQAIQNAMVNVLGTRNRGLKDGSKMVVINRATMPSVIAETAFISNTGDRTKLLSDDMQNKLSWGIADAIVTLFQKAGVTISKG